MRISPRQRHRIWFSRQTIQAVPPGFVLYAVVRAIWTNVQPNLLSRKLKPGPPTALLSTTTIMILPSVRPHHGERRGPAVPRSAPSWACSLSPVRRTCQGSHGGAPHRRTRVQLPPHAGVFRWQHLSVTAAGINPASTQPDLHRAPARRPPKQRRWRLIPAPAGRATTKPRVGYLDRGAMPQRVRSIVRR